MQIYYGPRAQAKPFMEDLGFYCDPSANVADFLTGVTVPSERRIRDGFEGRFPRTKEQIFAEYEKSPLAEQMKNKAQTYPTTGTAKENTENFEEAIHHDKHKGLPKNSPLTVSFTEQVRVCIKRQYQILWGDKPTQIIKQGSTLVQALIVGSLFYNAPSTTAGLFVKSGALFFALLFNSLLAMSEVTSSFEGRPIIAKHRSFALFHPAAFCIAQIAADIPVLLFQISHFSIVLYFMVGLKVSASAFFTFWFVIFSTTMAITALFRAVGAAFPTFDAASKVRYVTLSPLTSIPKEVDLLLAIHSSMFSKSRS